MASYVYLFLIFGVVTTVFGELHDKEWLNFKDNYGKQYKSKEEENFRRNVFVKNYRMIEKHNYKAVNGFKTYHLKMNKFGDLSHKEFIKLMNGYKTHLKFPNLKATTYLSPENVNVSQNVESIDWRKKDLVTPVKDQKHCGSCWAFSAVGALEAQHARKTKKLVSLSEQNLIDCSKKFHNMGCSGGLMDNAFAYIKYNHGIDTEKSYPYDGQENKCRFKKKNIGATDTGFVDIESGNEEKLKEAVTTIGPVSVAIDASHESLQFYSHGIYNEEECSSSDLDHGVLVVGFGLTEEGDKYWIIKNSWGKEWGEEGYFRLMRDNNNLCGIATSASYPLV